MIAQLKVSGSLKVSYWPEYATDNYISLPISNGEVRLFDITPQYIGSDYTNANGYYSITWYGSFMYYIVSHVLENDFVKLYESSGDPYERVEIFLPSGNRTINLTETSQASNIYYHVTKAHTYFKNTFGYNGMDFQLPVILNSGAGTNAAYDWEDNELQFGSQDNVEWGKFSDVIYHEYTHAVHDNLGGNPTLDLMEGIADYFACTINNDSEYGENTPSYNTRQLSNNIIYNPNNNPYVNGQAVAGACWDIREVLGSTIVDNLVFRALQILPKPTYIADFANNIKKADYQYYNSSYQDEIVIAFDNHGITVNIPEIPTISMQSGWGEVVTVSWTNVFASKYLVKVEYDYGSGYNEYSTVEVSGTTFTDNNVLRDKFGDLQARYSVKAVDNYNYASSFSNYASTSGQGQYKNSEDYDSNSITMHAYSLSNYPNPFNPLTNITYSLPEAGHVTIKVYDILGKEIVQLVNERKNAGEHHYSFNASNLSSGIYIYNLQITGAYGENAFNESKKMLLTK